MSKHIKATKKQLQERLRKRQKSLEHRGGGWMESVREAQQCLDLGQWDEARTVLERYDQAHPGEPRVLRLLLDVYHEQREYGDYCHVCKRLLAQDNRDRPLWLMLAAGYMGDARPVLALQTFRSYVERWPDDPMTESARDMIAQLRPVVEEILQKSPFPSEERLELGAMHEEMLAGIAWGNFERVIEVGEKLLARSPMFVSAMNNMSQAHSQLGHLDDAIGLSQRVLELESDNFHALANLARLLLLKGRSEEAEQTCQKLRLIDSENTDIWCKKAETFSFFGDDEGVLDVVTKAKAAGYVAGKTPDVALLLHLAGVAAARQADRGHGDWRQARQYWNEALRIRPHFELVAENLADSKKPVGKRQGAWAYGLRYWIAQSTLEQLVAVTNGRSPAESKDPGRRGEQAAAAHRFVEKHPEICAVVPLLLDRGDEAGRQIARSIAFMLDTPPMHEALRVFCLSQRGTDSLRTETASLLSQKSVFPDGRVRMWIEGEWRELELMGYEIIEEPMGEPHSPQVEKWASEGMAAVYDGDGDRAEMLFKKCLEIEPDRPELLNNLCAAYNEQGRDDESDALMREIHERWPDYFFGRSNMAVIAARAGRYDEAEELLKPLRQRKRLHITEYTALCIAHVQLFIAERNFEAAKSWLKMLKDMAPEHPAIEQLEPSLTIGGAIGRLLGFRRRRK